MNTHRWFGVLGIAAGAGLVAACGTGLHDDPLPLDVEADGSVDAAAPEVAPPPPPAPDANADASGGVVVDVEGQPCNYPSSINEICGRCGVRRRYCMPSGVWGPRDPACLEEKTGSQFCAIGETRTAACGRCGTRLDTCDTSTCRWSQGTCEGEGVCSPGEFDNAPGTCTGGSVVSRTCDDACQWGPASACGAPRGWVAMAAPPPGFLGRAGHSAVWTGTEIIFFGGRPDNSFGSELHDGAAYDPSTNQWRMLPPLPSEAGTGYVDHVAVWTGTEMIVFGGSENTGGTGAAYSPSTDTWRTIAPVPEANGLSGAVAGYSTSTAEMIVWGGELSGGDCEDGGRYCAGGRAYNPATDTWTTLPFAPIVGRTRARGGYIGTDFVVWGGITQPAGADSVGLADGARYDPAARTWVTLPSAPPLANGVALSTSVIEGPELFIWGGKTSSLLAETSTGGRYRVGGGWAPIGAPAPTVLEKRRSDAASWFGAGRLWIWSGASMSAPPATQTLGGGAWYDPVMETWGSMAETGEPAPRAGARAVWTGSEAVIWGGYPAGSGWSQSWGDIISAFGNGAIYRP